MTRQNKIVLISGDEGLIEHWKLAFKNVKPSILNTFKDLTQINPSDASLIWLDLSTKDVPQWNDPAWGRVLNKNGTHLKLIATSSNPKDSEAIEALDAGCSGYCHAYSDSANLLQVVQVVNAGQVWIGKTLMHRLIRSAGTAAQVSQPTSKDWSESLSPREREVAILAANGASNQDIAKNCRISERTVKAHMSAVFDKLNLTDRLQLALRVHGIH